MARRLTAIIVAASLFIAACTPRAGEELTGNSSDRPNLAGTRWSLRGLGNEAVSGAPTVTLDFGRDGTISGNDGCNQYQGSYTVDGNSIVIGGDVAGTLAACPDEIETRARVYREALFGAASFALDETQLVLDDGIGRPLARFEPAVRSPIGVAWEVIAYNNGAGGVVSVILDTHVTASFGTDGRVTGNAGCNQYFASYQLAGSSLTFAAAGATRMSCSEPEGLMEQEALFLEALHSTSTFSLDGARLELRDAHGALAVSLDRRD